MADGCSKECICLAVKAALWYVLELRVLEIIVNCAFSEFAVGFFLLGDSLKDAVNVCVKQLKDFQLAIALARVYAGEDSPIFTYLIEEHVLPQAIANGDRWLTSWAFWMNHRRDLALRVLIVSPSFISGSLRLISCNSRPSRRSLTSCHRNP